mgnify:CR=1 FL=1
MQAGDGSKISSDTELYAATDLSYIEICRQCGGTLNGFSRYVNTYHRHLMLERNGIKCSPEEAGDIKMNQRHGVLKPYLDSLTEALIKRVKRGKKGRK